MSAARAHARHETPWATKYETLRSHVLHEASAGGYAGLIVVLREGVAAWMERSLPAPVPARSELEPVERIEVSVLSDEGEASFVHVMASMALACEYRGDYA